MKPFFFIQTQKGIMALLCLFLGHTCICQVAELKEKEQFPQIRIIKKKERQKPYVGLEIIASMLPPAKIKRREGNYRPYSRLQSSYEIGLNYHYDRPKQITFSYGFHLIVGKTNFFLSIPEEDTRAFPYQIDGHRIIELKDVWWAFKFPFMIQKEVQTKKWDNIILKAGVNLMYSPIWDLNVGGGVNDTSNQYIGIYSGFFSGNNKYLPWVNFSLGGCKDLVLKNNNILTLQLIAVISPRAFYRGNYRITIPGQPVATGTYKVYGNSLGLSIQYYFTSSNKKAVKEYLKKGF